MNYSMPFPLVVADGRAPGQIVISANASVYEFNPYEFGSWDEQVNLLSWVKIYTDEPGLCLYPCCLSRIESHQWTADRWLDLCDRIRQCGIHNRNIVKSIQQRPGANQWLFLLHHHIRHHVGLG